LHARILEIANVVVECLDKPKATRPFIKALGRSISDMVKGRITPTRRRVYRTFDDVEDPEVLSKDWDPEGVTEEDLEPSPPNPDVLSGTQVRSLLLDVLRRAIHDWVLYKNSSRLEHKELARHAFIWLFEEEEGHPWRLQRQQEGLDMLSLESVCDVLDIDIETVRRVARNTTERQIKTAGRPPERRKKVGDDSSHYAEHDVNIQFTYPSEEE
jgi:hypothetical protein